MKTLFRIRKDLKRRKRENIYINTLYPVLPSKKYRETGQKYIYNGEIRIWDGRVLRCKHNNQKYTCKKCGGKGLCETHGTRKTQCKKCNDTVTCKHGQIRFTCVACDVCKKRDGGVYDEIYDYNKQTLWYEWYL